MTAHNHQIPQYLRLSIYFIYFAIQNFHSHQLKFSTFTIDPNLRVFQNQIAVFHRFYSCQAPEVSPL